MSTNWGQVFALIFAAIAFIYVVCACIRLKSRRPWVGGLDRLLAFADDAGILGAMGPDWTKHGAQDACNRRRLGLWRCIIRLDLFEIFGLSWPRSVVNKVSWRDVHVTEEQIRVRLFEPTRPAGSEPAPLLFFFFSGGMVFGGVNSETMRPKYIAQKLGVIVASIEYPLAPEQRFPKQKQQVCSAAEHILRHPGSLGVPFDGSRVATYGYSAGGYLSIVTALDLAEKGFVLRGHFAQHPMGTPSGSASMDAMWHTSFGWHGNCDKWAWAQLLEGTEPSAHNDAKVHPLFATDAQLAKISPGFVTFGTYDVLRDAGEAYAERLRGLGKLIGSKEYPISHISLRSQFWLQQVDDIIAAISGVLMTPMAPAAGSGDGTKGVEMKAGLLSAS